MIKVVAAIIKSKDEKILIAQRNINKSQGGLWEFPGGKIELGETVEDAIIREIKEELNMDIEVVSKFGECIYQYPEKTIKLIALNCFAKNQTYKLIEHESAKWVTVADMPKYEFASADKYFVKKLIK